MTRVGALPHWLRKVAERSQGTILYAWLRTDRLCVSAIRWSYPPRREIGGFVEAATSWVPTKEVSMRSGKMLSSALLLGVVAVALSVAPARADVVTDWNMITGALVANDVGNNPRLRTLAMVHVAMSDAINTVQNRYTRRPPRFRSRPTPRPRPRAATRRILSQIYPQQKAKIEETYAASLAGNPDGPARPQASSSASRSPARSKPIAQRRHQCSPIITVRTPPPAHRDLPTTTPIWDQYARAQPWIIKRADQFRPGPRQHCRARVGHGLQRGQEPRRHEQHGAYC